MYSGLPHESAKASSTVATILDVDHDCSTTTSSIDVLPPLVACPHPTIATTPDCDTVSAADSPCLKGGGNVTSVPRFHDLRDNIA